VNSRYRVRLFDPQDRGSFEDLYRAVYGTAWREKTNLRWTLDCPLADAGAAVAVDGDTVVSAQPYCDLPLHTPWGPSRTTLLLDVATHPAHQRCGLFRRVVTAAREAAFERGASVITTTPNRIAFRGFMTLPEWVRLCSLDCLFLPLGMGDRVPGGSALSFGMRLALGAWSLCLKGLIPQAGRSSQPGHTIEAPWSPGAEADDLWSSAAADRGIMVVRNHAFLRWRFGADYRLFLLRDRRGPAGYTAARTLTRAGTKVGMILDCMTAGTATGALPLLEAVITWLRDQRASAVMGYFPRGSMAWRQAHAAGFFCLPRPLVPREYPVCASVRPEDPHRAELLDSSRWYMSLADSDLA
jgi:hypothetical protein